MDAYIPSDRRLPVMRILFIVAIVAGMGWGAWSLRHPAEAREERLIFGGHIATRIHAVMPRFASTGAAEAVDRAYRAVADIESLMNAYSPDSDVARINTAPADTPVTVDPRTMRVLLESLRFHRLSDGAFDITVMPLMEIYKPLIRETRETGKPVAAFPDDAAIRAARERVGSDKLVLDRARSTVTKRLAGVRIDLGAIAEGYAADVAMESLQADGIIAGFVDMGGEIRLFGHHPGGRPWNVGITDPANPESTLETLPGESDQSFSTSGTYQQYFEYQGQRYAHIADPRTGLPVTGPLVGVTVICPRNAMAADALSTALSVLGVEQGSRLIDLFPGTRAYFQLREDNGSTRLIIYPPIEKTAPIGKTS